MWLSKLKEMKMQSGLTTEEIAQKASVPLGTLVKIFAGQTKDPQLETMRRVVYSLGHTLDDLLGDTQPEPVLDDLSGYLDMLRTRPEMKMLFSLSKNATREEVEQAVAIIEALQKTSRR